jgi:4-aminobutyrate aminotransferase-like enzyme
MLLSCGTYDSTIRWIPPLNVTEGQISDALNIFADALKVVS